MFHVKHFFLSGCFFCLKRRLCLKRHGGFASNGRFLSENAGFCLKNDPPRFVLGANQHLFLFFWSSQPLIFRYFLTFSAFSDLLALSGLLISRFLGLFEAFFFAHHFCGGVYSSESENRNTVHRNTARKMKKMPCRARKKPLWLKTATTSSGWASCFWTGRCHKGRFLRENGAWQRRKTS